MSPRMSPRHIASAAAVTLALASAGLATARPAAAHGSMEDPVSRVAACYAEGPEAPTSEACRAAVAASGAQAFYDWNEVNIGDAAGRHRELVPDGKLCSAGRDKYRGLDLPRADWPASELTAGEHTFRYRATAPHRGTFELYMTKEGYDPTQPLAWDDLEAEPFATATDPRLSGGSYVFTGTVPEREGRHLVYGVWQRSDSPEAFYTCSDVVFGGAAATPAEAPDDTQIEAGADESTVDHGGHGADHGGADHGEEGASPQGGGSSPAAPADPADPADPTAPAELAQTGAAEGADTSTAALAVGGAAVLAVGSGVLFASLRRGTPGGGSGGRHRG